MSIQIVASKVDVQDRRTNECLVSMRAVGATSPVCLHVKLQHDRVAVRVIGSVRGDNSRET